MILSACAQIESADLLAHAWHRVRLYRNVEFTSETIWSLHRPAPKHAKNVRRQAEEIRFCLVQAEEYFQSARAASLATRPLLLYYALMSLALAEVLLKRDGTHRLERLRHDHAAHGLTLSATGSFDRREPLASILARLQASVQLRQPDIPYGTFVVWRGTVREPPIPVLVREMHGGGTSGGPRTMFAGLDEPPSDAKSYSLADALRSLPQLSATLGFFGILPATARADLSADINVPGGGGTLVLIVHPGFERTLAELYDRILFRAGVTSALQATELPSGLILRLPVVGGAVDADVKLPPTVCMSLARTYFVTNGWDLGEFGAYYVAMHILGNVVRYFPDVWMPHVETSTQFAQVADRLCTLVAERAPILFASEMDRTYYIGTSK